MPRLLDRLGVGARDYLSLVVFADGYGRRSCRGTDVMAVTARGSRVVRVCGRRFSRRRVGERCQQSLS